MPVRSELCCSLSKRMHVGHRLVTFIVQKEKKTSSLIVRQSSHPAQNFFGALQKRLERSSNTLWIISATGSACPVSDSCSCSKGSADNLWGICFALFVYAFHCNEVFIVAYLGEKNVESPPAPQEKLFLMVTYCANFTLLMFCNNMCVVPASKLLKLLKKWSSSFSCFTF